MYPGDFSIPIFSILHTNIRLLKLFLELPSLCLLLHILTLIINLFTAAESHVELYEAALEIETEGHKGIALFLDFSEQAVNFSSMEEKLSVSKRVLVKNISPLIGVDVHAYDETLPISNLTEGLLNGSLSEAERFDFRSEKLNAAFQAFLHEKIMESLFVVCDLLNAVSHLYFLSVIRLYSSGNSGAGTKSIVRLKVSTAYTRTEILSPIRKVFPLRSPLVISSFSIKTK